MLLYHGRRINDEGVVTVHSIHNQSPHSALPCSPRPGRRYAGPHNWGNGGTGPLQLSWDLLLHVTSDPAASGRLYRRFCAEVVAHLDHDGWTLTYEEIAAWVRLASSTLIV